MLVDLLIGLLIDLLAGLLVGLLADLLHCDNQLRAAGERLGG